MAGEDAIETNNWFLSIVDSFKETIDLLGWRVLNRPSYLAQLKRVTQELENLTKTIRDDAGLDKGGS